MGFFSDFGGLIGGVVAGGASLLASRENRKAAEKAADVSRDIYKRSYADLAPYREVGKNALAQLSGVYLDKSIPYTASPGYDFRLAEGTKALERGAAARGRQFSGAQGKALTRFGQNIATEDYNNQFNILASMAGLGSGAVGQGNQAGTNLAVNVGNAGLAAGRARASGYEGVGSAINSGINNQLFLETLRSNPNIRFG